MDIGQEEQNSKKSHTRLQQKAAELTKQYTTHSEYKASRTKSLT